MKKSKSVLRREALMTDRQMDMFRENTTRCTRLGPGDRRSPRGHMWRKQYCALINSSDPKKHIVGRREYDITESD